MHETSLPMFLISSLMPEVIRIYEISFGTANSKLKYSFALRQVATSRVGVEGHRSPLDPLLCHFKEFKSNMMQHVMSIFK